MFEMANFSPDKQLSVIVEGNIGSGKTSFLNHLKKYENVCVLAEPVSKWQNCRGNNLLGLMYEDPKKWSFSFQSYVQFTMLQQHMYQANKAIKIMERSIYSARYCFVEKMLRDGIMPSPSASVINEWFKWITTNMNVSVDLIVYLRTSPEVVHKRIIERGRKEEKTVSLDYLRGLHEIHENWLHHKNLFTCPAPVLTLNANLDKSFIVEEYKKFEPCIFNKVVETYC